MKGENSVMSSGRGNNRVALSITFFLLSSRSSLKRLIVGEILKGNDKKRRKRRKTKIDKISHDYSVPFSKVVLSSFRKTFIDKYQMTGKVKYYVDYETLAKIACNIYSSPTQITRLNDCHESQYRNI